jgi:hypothetical protein
MEVTVREKHWHGQYTYEPVCEMSKMLAEVSNQKNLSMRMIKTLRKYCILVKILPEKGKEKGGKGDKGEKQKE